MPLGIDPKLAWALRHPGKFPVDLHTAPRETLLRVPGLGVRNVDRLLAVRRWHRVTLADLARLRVPLKKVMPFVVTADHRPATVGGAAWRGSGAARRGRWNFLRPTRAFSPAGCRLAIMLRQVTFVPTFAGWQRAARAALLAETPPDAILWQELGQDQPLLDLRGRTGTGAARAIDREGAEEIRGDRHSAWRVIAIPSAGRCCIACSGA